MRASGRRGVNITTGGQTGFQAGHWRGDPPAPKGKVLPVGPGPARIMRQAAEATASLNQVIRAARLRGFKVEVFLDEEIEEGRTIPALLVIFTEPD